MIFRSALLLLGASGIIGQVVLLRELLILFSGNELSIGIFLGNWLVLEALGCLAAGRIWAKSEKPAAAFAAMQAFFAALLPPVLYAARSLHELSGVAPGEGFSVAAMFVSMLMLLVLVSAPHGALFALAARMRERAAPDSGAGGLLYGWETLGTLVGGLLLTFWLLPRWNSFRILLSVSGLNLLGCALVLLGADRAQRSPKFAGLCSLAGLSVAALAFGPAAKSWHQTSIQRQWPGSEVAFYGNSVYGNVTVLKSGEQLTFLTDGVMDLTVPVPDVEAVEELAHLTLLSHPDPKEILILGGGAGGLLREVLKHPVRHVDYAELDPLLLAAVAKFPTPLTADEFNDPRVSVHETDGRLFVKNFARGYDAIIIGVPRPDNLESNRLFTREFFALAKTRLKPGGLLALSLPGSTAFMERNLARLNSCIEQTLAGIFKYVRPIPGDKNIFLASDSPEIARLDPILLAQRLRARGIRANFAGPAQISLRLEEQWTRMLRDFLAPVETQAGVNLDFHPRAVFFDLSNWNAMFSPMAARFFGWVEFLSLPRLAAALAALCLILLVWHRRGQSLLLFTAPAAIAATGFAGMVFNLSLTFAFQALYGYVYLWIGLLVSVFMAGAAAASLFLARKSGPVRRLFLSLEIALALFSVALPMAFLGLARAHIPDAVLKGAFLFLCLASGALTGAQFPLACRLRGVSPAVFYSCDLLGGWLGGVVGGAMLLPVLGLQDACLCVALLKLASLAFCAVALRDET